MPTSLPSIQQLQRALAIAEQIQELEEQLASIVGNESTATQPAPAAATRAPAAGKRGGKRFVSPEARAKMAAAQRARWAKKNGPKAAAAPKPATATRKKRVLSPEGRARIVAALKARHAAAKKAKAR